MSFVAFSLLSLSPFPSTSKAVSQSYFLEDPTVCARPDY